jgi:transcriptional regulator with XRE-family HTH domain
MGVNACLKQVGENIKKARRRRGLRQVDVNEKIGVNYRHYQNIEAGRVNLTIDTLCRLARLFRVSLEDLVRDICT